MPQRWWLMVLAAVGGLLFHALMCGPQAAFAVSVYVCIALLVTIVALAAATEGARKDRDEAAKDEERDVVERPQAFQRQVSA